MKQDAPALDKKLSIKTRLSHVGRAGTHTHGLVNPPVYRGSTVLYPDVATRDSFRGKAFQRGLTYGLDGNPTHHALEDMVAEIEGGTHAQIVPTGLAAITVPLIAYLKAGDHILFPDSLYGAGRGFAERRLPNMGVSVEYYPPTMPVAEVEALIRPDTRVLYLESPGSYTFEMQDIPALCIMAHRRGLVTMLDNTWGIQAFQPFEHGVDVSIQALTKYVVGHSDVLLGAITTADETHWKIFRRTALDLGMYASPDDCWLALRGGRTMAMRLERQLESALEVARFLAARPEVVEVRYPPLPGSVGHELWKRDFTGGASLFAVVFQPGYSREQVYAMTNALQLFGIGASWGGYESLALPAGDALTRSFGSTFPPGEVVRYHIGLEAPTDLIADFEQAFRALKANAPHP
jgi:cystathionine beta-lyase